MADFPEELEIKIINNKNKQPVEGIMLNLHIFASHKNDYYFNSDYSNSDGVIRVTKQMLETEINACRNSFIMDYSSLLQDCKPYIEIKAENSLEIEERKTGTRESWMYDDAGKRNYYHLKGCRNASILGNSIIIKLEQGAEKQKVVFEVKLVN